MIYTYIYIINTLKYIFITWEFELTVFNYILWGGLGYLPYNHFTRCFVIGCDKKNNWKGKKITFTVRLVLLFNLYFTLFDRFIISWKLVLVRKTVITNEIINVSIILFHKFPLSPPGFFHSVIIFIRKRLFQLRHLNSNLIAYIYGR